jgi:hypothetical protein
MTTDDEDCLFNSFARNQSAHVLFRSVREDLRQEDLPFSSRKINAVAPEMEAFESVKGELPDGLSRWSGLLSCGGASGPSGAGLTRRSGLVFVCLQLTIIPMKPDCRNRRKTKQQTTHSRAVGYFLTFHLAINRRCHGLTTRWPRLFCDNGPERSLQNGHSLPWTTMKRSGLIWLQIIAD